MKGSECLTDIQKKKSGAIPVEIVGGILKENLEIINRELLESREEFRG